MLGDWVEVSAIGNRAEQLLTGIPASRVQAVPGGFRCVISTRQLGWMKALAREKGITLTLLRQGGMGVTLAGYRSRFGLALGLLVFFFLMRFFEQFNWSVKYVGITQAEQELVAAALWENQLNEGQLVTKEKLRQTERRLMDENNDFGWVTLNFSKGRLVVECTRAEQAAPLPQAYEHHLVASENALIVAMDVQGGFPQKQVGQTVARGEVLVSASKVSRLEEVVTQPTQGRVIGEFTVEYQVALPLEQEVEVLTRLGTPWVQVQIGNAVFTVAGEEQPEKGVVHRNGLTIAGFALPATIITIDYPVRERQTITLTSKAALERARYRCLCTLHEQYPDARLIAEENHQKIRENVLEYCWKAKIRANIAIEGTSDAPISATDDGN